MVLDNETEDWIKEENCCGSVVAECTIVNLVNTDCVKIILCVTSLSVHCIGAMVC